MVNIDYCNYLHFKWNGDIMLIAICGRVDNLKSGSIRGNGKTLTAVYLAYLDYLSGRKIYTNFHTEFSENFKLSEILDKFNDGCLNNSTIVIDEAQIYLNNSGVSVKTRKAIITLFIAQSRKKNVDIIITTQRFKQIHKELREQVDKILITTKHHFIIDEKTNNPIIYENCDRDNCDKEHVIRIYNVYDDVFYSALLNCQEIGKLYNTDEVVIDDYFNK